MMPSSFVDSFPPIIKMLIDLQPTKVIDVGPGYGKYGLACREYLPNLQRLDCVEVPQGRYPIQDQIYDTVYTGDVRLITNPEFWETYDVVLLIDVIEHMTHDDGHRLLAHMQRGCARVLVSTPKIFEEQSDDHNPHETHLSLWSWDDFAEHGVKFDISTIDSVIYVLRQGAKHG